MAKFPEISHFFTLHDSLLAVICKRRVTHKLRNSSVLYHKTKNPFEAKFFINHVKTNNMEKYGSQPSAVIARVLNKNAV